MCYYNFIFIKCVNNIHILRFIFIHGKYYYIGNTHRVLLVINTVSLVNTRGVPITTSVSLSIRCQLLIPRVSVNFRYREFQSTFDSESFSQILTVKNLKFQSNVDIESFNQLLIETFDSNSTRDLTETFEN